MELGLGAAVDADVFVVKLDGANGSPIWAFQLGETGNDSATSIAVDAAGNAYVGGGFSDFLHCPAIPPCLVSQGGTDGFVARVTAAGALDWVQVFGGSSIDQANAVATDSEGNVAVTGVLAANAKSWAAQTLCVDRRRPGLLRREGRSDGRAHLGPQLPRRRDPGRERHRGDARTATSW